MAAIQAWVVIEIIIQAITIFIAAKPVANTRFQIEFVDIARIGTVQISRAKILCFCSEIQKSYTVIRILWVSPFICLCTPVGNAVSGGSIRVHLLHHQIVSSLPVNTIT